MECMICHKTFNNNYSFSNHRRIHNISANEYYEKYMKKSGDGICQNKNCNNPTTKIGIKGYTKYCSDKCANTSDEHILAVKERFVNDPEKRNLFIKRAKETYLKTYSKEKWDAITSKTYNTKKEKYGDDFQSKLTKAQWEKVSDSERKDIAFKAISNRSSWYSSYNFFGKEIKLQGYEPYVVDFLINEYGMTENDIILGVSNIPKFTYSVEGKEFTYYPDIYLPKLNMIIEVKSNFTYFLREEINKLKELAVLKQNIKFLFAVIDAKSKTKLKLSLECFKNKLDWAISSQDSKSKDMSKVQRLFQTEVESSDSKCRESLND